MSCLNGSILKLPVNNVELVTMSSVLIVIVEEYGNLLFVLTAKLFALCSETVIIEEFTSDKYFISFLCNQRYDIVGM